MTLMDVPPTTRVDEPVLEMTGITVSFLGVTVIDDVDLRLFPGEVHALMGENGAGKSTLIKALTGANPADCGTITMDGVPLRIAGTADGAAAGIAAVYQETQLCANLTVAENVMLGKEIRGHFGIDWRATRRVAAETLTQLGLEDLDPKSRVALLPPAIQQLVAIARAMVGDPRVVVLDEPTSSLERDEVAKLFAVIRRLRDRGVAILFVSHFLEQVYTISDRMTVLRNGRKEGEYLTRQLDRADLISKMIGKDIAGLRALGSHRQAHRHEPSGSAVYQATALARRGEIEPTDILLYPGEVVGIAGLRGSGRTELASLMSGAEKWDGGELAVNGKPTVLSSPSAGLKNRIAMSGENRRDGGVIGELSIRENIVLALQGLRGWSRPLSKAERDELVESYIDALDIRPASPDTPVKYLSGGNQQKVLLARWLATRPRVLILDEPTSGVDVSAKLDIQTKIAKLAADGVAVVFISSELEELVRLSDRIVVLKDREKIGEVSNGPGITVDTIVEMIAADVDEY